MAGTRIVDRLAKKAAEKRAFNWMYGGGSPYGGGGFGMNPYLGGAGYGGGMHGMPMMAQSFASPYGRGGYHGMDPRFAGTYNEMLHQGMGQQGQMFNEAGLPGAQVGVQGQQVGVAGQAQDVAARNPLAQAGAASAAWGHQEPQWQDMRSDVRGDVGRLGTSQANLYQGQLGDLSKQMRDQEDALEAARNAATSSKAEAMGSMFSRGQLAGMHPGNQGGFWNTLGNTVLGATGLGRESATKAVSAAEAHAAAQKKYDSQMAELKRRHVELSGQLKSEQGRQGQLDSLGGSAATQSAAREERGRTATGQVQDTFRAGLPAMGRAGEVGTQRVENPGQPGQTPPPVAPRLQPAASAPPTVKPQQPATPPPAPPMGGGGPRPSPTSMEAEEMRKADDKTASVKIAALANTAARVQIERQRVKQAGLADSLFGAQGMSMPGAATRTGQGKKIVDTSNLMENIRKARPGSVLPPAAQKAAPKLDAASIMSSLGLQGMPTSLAHLAPEAAAGMGVSPETHAKLRQMLGLG